MQFDEFLFEDLKTEFFKRLVRHSLLVGEERIPYYIAFIIGREMKLDRNLIREILIDLHRDGLIELDGNGKIILNLSDKSF